MSLSNSLSLNKLYIVWSKITQKPYLTRDRKGFVFLSKAQAYDFTKNTPDTYIDDGDYYEPKYLYTLLYASGVMVVVLINGLNEEQIILGTSQVEQKFYNSNLNAALSLFKLTKDKDYLRIIAEYYFIVPARIKTSPQKEIMYATIHTAENEYQYLGFTDMDEYSKWAQNAAGWSPLLVNFDVMEQISKDKGYIINPMGNSIRFPSIIMKKYSDFAAKKDFGASV